jgi:hypothetical protein
MSPYVLFFFQRWSCWYNVVGCLVFLTQSAFGVSVCLLLLLLLYYYYYHHHHHHQQQRHIMFLMAIDTLMFWNSLIYTLSIRENINLTQFLSLMFPCVLNLTRIPWTLWVSVPTRNLRQFPLFHVSPFLKNCPTVSSDSFIDSSCGNYEEFRFSHTDLIIFFSFVSRILMSYLSKAFVSFVCLLFLFRVCYIWDLGWRVVKALRY